MPRWAHRLEVAVWVSDEHRRMRWLNDLAAALLGTKEDRCLGRPCFEIVAGRDDAGCRYCTAQCPPLQAAAGEACLPAVTLEVGPAPQRRWVHTLLIPVRSATDAVGLVHCALDAERSHRLAEYMRRVARRTPTESLQWGDELRPLRPREREVLEHLARDEDLPAIARGLGISLTTVRNHVQRLLAAMGAHSVPEAVARFLVEPNSLDGDLC